MTFLPILRSLGALLRARFLRAGGAAFLLVALPLLPAASAQTPAAPPATPLPALYIPEGQLISAPVRVYAIDTTLSLENQPVLVTYSLNPLGVPVRGEFEPREIVSGLKFDVKLPGADGKEGSQTVQKSGTLLLFDFSSADSYAKLYGDKRPFFPCARFVPLLKWSVKNASPADEQKTLFGTAGQTVLVGNLFRGAWYAFVLVLILCLVVMIAARFVKAKPGRHWYGLFAGEDGHASLSQLQLGLWTAAGAFCVLTFGLVQYAFPDIPSSLIVLLGLSLVTGGSAYALNKSTPSWVEAAARQKADEATAARQQAQADLNEAQKDEQNATGEKVAAAKKALTTAGAAAEKLEPDTAQPSPTKPVPAPVPNFFAQLIEDNNEPSIARAQMLVWTVISLVLFLFKSLTNGEIWVIPWELVVLMGISQTSYLVPKYWKFNEEKKQS